MKTITVEIEVPDWARCVTKDKDGTVRFFEFEPNNKGSASSWFEESGGLNRCAVQGPPCPNWRDSLKEIK